jgi:very-short-patch-repair endonuclease
MKKTHWTIEQFKNYMKDPIQVYPVNKKSKKYSSVPAYFWKINGLPIPCAEYKFHPTRKWRFDFCYPENKLAIEIEGGIFSKGRHVQGAGYIGDMQKYNAATLLGYRILRYQPGKINFDEIKQALKLRRDNKNEQTQIRTKIISG